MFRVMLGFAMKWVSPLLLCLLVLISGAPAQPIPRVRPKFDPPPTGFSRSMVLWPDGAPLAKGNTLGDIPKLYYYPAIGPGVGSAVIVLPGGGYSHLVMEKEGATEAK